MQIRLSPTSVRDFLTCPFKYALRYHANLEPDTDVEALRIGGAWHKCHETYKLATADHDRGDPESAARATLDKLYCNIPPGTPAPLWEAEREMIWRSFVVYQDVYAGKELKSLAVEARHVFPLYNPHTGMPMPEKDVVCVVKVDEVVAGPAVFEMKSTSREIAPGSDYWQSLRLDRQVSFYSFWANMVYGEISPTLFDVWRRPLLRLKKDESVLEYADRVEAKLRENPAEHFQRHEIARTDADLAQFELELWNIYQTIKAMQARDGWYGNESQCISFMGSCPYKNICFREGATRTIKEGLVPLGFRKKKDLTAAVCDSMV
jgi:hypothetical protein